MGLTACGVSGANSISRASGTGPVDPQGQSGASATCPAPTDSIERARLPGVTVAENQRLQGMQEPRTSRRLRPVPKPGTVRQQPVTVPAPTQGPGTGATTTPTTRPPATGTRPGTVENPTPVTPSGPAELAQAASEQFARASHLRGQITNGKKAYNFLPFGRSFYEGTASIDDVINYGLALNTALDLAERALAAGATRAQLGTTLLYCRALTARGVPHRVSGGVADPGQVLEDGSQLDRLKALKDRIS